MVQSGPMLLRDPTWRHQPPFDDNDRRPMVLITGLCVLILATPFLLLLALALLT